MDPRPQRHNRRVRFNIPPTTSRPAPTSILRQPPPAPPPPTEQPAPFRRTSLPDMRHSSSHLAERRRRALVALKDMQNYLKEALNFHGDDSRRALTPLSIHALSTLIAHLAVLRHDFDLAVIRRDEKLLQNVDLDPRTRHPAEQLHPNLPITNDYERYARNGHKKRLRREAEHRLLQFVAKQLDLPPHTLRDLPPVVREQRELDAFKSRLKRFNTRSHPARLGPSAANAAAQASPRHNSSAPTSPLERPYTNPQSPHTDPPPMLRRAFDLTNAPGSAEELFPAMAELRLPGSYHDDQYHAPPQQQPALRRANTPRYPAAQHAAHSTSPYAAPAASPYASAATSPYAAPAASPYAAATTSPYAAPAASPYAAAATSPYAAPAASPYATAATAPYNHAATSPYNHPHASPYVHTTPTAAPGFAPPTAAYHHHAAPPLTSTPPSATQASPHAASHAQPNANYAPHAAGYPKTGVEAPAGLGHPAAGAYAPGAGAGVTGATAGTAAAAHYVYNQGAAEQGAGTRYPQRRKY